MHDVCIIQTMVPSSVVLARRTEGNYYRIFFTVHINLFPPTCVSAWDKFKRDFWACAIPKQGISQGLDDCYEIMKIIGFCFRRLTGLKTANDSFLLNFIVPVKIQKKFFFKFNYSKKIFKTAVSMDFIIGKCKRLLLFIDSIIFIFQN